MGIVFISQKCNNRAWVLTQVRRLWVHYLSTNPIAYMCAYFFFLIHFSTKLKDLLYQRKGIMLLTSNIKWKLTVWNGKRALTCLSFLGCTNKWFLGQGDRRIELDLHHSFLFLWLTILLFLCCTWGMMFLFSDFNMYWD